MFHQGLRRLQIAVVQRGSRVKGDARRFPEVAPDQADGAAGPGQLGQVVLGAVQLGVDGDAQVAVAAGQFAVHGEDGVDGGRAVRAEDDVAVPPPGGGRDPPGVLHGQLAGEGQPRLRQAEADPVGAAVVREQCQVLPDGPLDLRRTAALLPAREPGGHPMPFGPQRLDPLQDRVRSGAGT
ncbi:hypothetical protein GCM10010358_63420 [Streptomyces minutiscleroticus]|uniref:Uncharacterized protein n=1 Tax=Streptomyces minutiscleroticus TaxID=68238 RepID=A0A918NWU6_9ACTN|nr:hypothetical protein [Streptomyces minutiscleroticus]GGY00814.1 hypothetical protein GCM10010358_63420 [Streptomyces minutiscleroticus]